MASKQHQIEEFRDRCIAFGVGVIMLMRRVPRGSVSPSRKEQMEKSATSIGANFSESQSAQSRRDFISKFEIALKESREVDYWLRVLKATDPRFTDEIDGLLAASWQITAILVSSIKTAKINGRILEPRLTPDPKPQ